jgi:hypothetical protein
LDNVISWSQVQSGDPSLLSDTQVNLARELQIVAVALPFVEVVAGMQDLEDDQIAAGQLLDFLDRRFDNQSLPVFAFAKSAEDWRQHLRAVESDAELKIQAEGPPRLVGWMAFDGTIQWGVAGVVAESNLDFFRRLEREGISYAESLPQREFAAELAAHHPKYLEWDEIKGVLRIPFHGARLTPDGYTQVFQCAWSQHWDKPAVRSEVITSEPGYAILLSTGARVLKHFSVFRLLHQSRLLTEAMGFALVGKVRASLSKSVHPTVVVDQPASRYICHALFVETGYMPDVVSFEDLLDSTPRPAKVVVFADAIYRGDTVQRVLLGLKQLKIAFDCVVTCVDLGEDTRRQPLAPGATVFSLVELGGFDPQVTTDAAATKDIQTDAITHVPIKHDASPFISLATLPEAEEFLAQRPHHFTVGYHRLRARTHTVTLPLEKFLEDPESTAKAVAWMVAEIRLGLTLLRAPWVGRQVTVFTRFDTKIGSLEDSLSRELDAALTGHLGIFLVRLPAAYQGRRTIFPQPGFNLFADCKEKTAEQLPLGGKRTPKSGYLAIYLDDATVTGHSLRDFIHHVVQANLPRPSAILSVAMVNRLSPGSIRFLRLCRNLTVGPEENDIVPFAYRYVFNLQVASQRHPYVTGHALLETLFETHLFHPPVLRRYVDALHSRFRLPVGRIPWIHVFHPGTTGVSVSTAAVQFRHLLSLNQQNEPVVLEIMNRLQTLTQRETADPSVLTILALEPSFLANAPLRQFGREMIISLAIRVLNSLEPTSRKSDALSVLAAHPGAFFDHYNEFAPAVFCDETLSLQLAAHLIANMNMLSHAYEPPMLQGLPETAHKQQAWLHRSLHVKKKVDELSQQIRTREQAQEAIFTLGSHFLRHSEADNADWRVVWESLNNLSHRWSILANAERRRVDLDNCRRQAVFAASVVLPAFPALIYFLENRGANEEAEQLRNAHADAQACLTTYVELLPGTVKDFTLDRVRLIAHALDELQLATWITRSPSNRLLSGDIPERKGGPLARFLPKVFSAPSGLLVRIGESILGSRALFDRFREFAPGKHKMTVAPVPTKILEQILRMLLQNVQKHGHVDSLIVEQFPTDSAISEREWKVQLTNRVTGKSKTETGQGIQLAKEAGEPFRIRLECDYQRNDTEWVAVLIVPSVFMLDQQIPGIEA